MEEPLGLLLICVIHVLFMNGVSIIVPTLNEEGNIRELVQRLDRVLQSHALRYEVIVVDDHSTDATREVLADLSRSYPIAVHLKKGQRGKAQSLLEGCTYAAYDVLAVIDADLQYPPEAIPEMVEKLQGGFDIVVANRRVHREAVVRKFVSRAFTFFVNALHGFDCDVQAGLKVFRREVLQEVTFHPTPWTFDLVLGRLGPHPGLFSSLARVEWRRGFTLSQSPCQ